MNGTIIFLSKKHNGGYGDRLIGMVSAITIARLTGMKLESIWEEDFQKICDSSQTFVTIPPIYIDINCYNRKSHPVLENENILETWKEKIILFQANQPVDILLWKNPYMISKLVGVSYEAEAIRSFKEVFTNYISVNEFLQSYDEEYECGIQIRCGDTYCMPHALAEQYIPETQFVEFAKSLKKYLEERGIQGRVYVTSDARKLYEIFHAISDEKLQFIFWNRKEDIHFDSHNSNNKYLEIVRDHICLQNCKKLITSLRSNFGMTAAYCSSVCNEIIFYSSKWNEPLKIDYIPVPTSTLVLKEYQQNIQKNYVHNSLTKQIP